MKPIRVLHIIDSLAIGGAERVAINLVNGLNHAGIEAWLCTSRSEGPLKSYLKYPERYIFLHKKNRMDWRAFLKLIKIIRQQKIQIIHAHSSSFLWAIPAKWLSGIKIVWQDHNGARNSAGSMTNSIIKLCSGQFSAVLPVNQDLYQWALNNLHIAREQVVLLRNFPDVDFPNFERFVRKKELIILCLANLRHPKDHITLLQSILLLKQISPFTPFKLWLVGKDNKDDYSRQLSSFIKDNALQDTIEILGSHNDVASLLIQADIGVLSSESEGLPVALLEYGLVGLPVVCTEVGECPKVLGQGTYGILVPPKAPEQLAGALARLLQNPEERTRYGSALQVQVQQHYSKHSVVRQLMDIYAAITKK